MTGLNGAKRPASCKKCGARCICPCHQQTEPPVHVGRGANAEDCPACKGTNPDYPFICPGPDAEQLARTTAKNPAATEATDIRKQPMHPHPCTATIEGRATPGRRRVQCTREARHPENHVGPKLGSDGRVLWTDHQAGATPHKEQP